MSEQVTGQLRHDRTQDRLQISERATEQIQTHVEPVVDSFVNGVLGYKVEDENLVCLLTDTVQAPNPLLDHHGIPGQVIIHEDFGELVVQALAADFGRKQQADRLGCTEFVYDLLFAHSHAAEQQDAFNTLVSESATKIMECRAEVGKQDYFLVWVLFPVAL